MDNQIKSLLDFSTKEGYIEYIQTFEFHEKYNVLGKTARQLQADLLLYPEWMEFIEKGVKYINNNPPGWRKSWNAFTFQNLVEKYVEESATDDQY